jgi:hypothetical protein
MDGVLFIETRVVLNRSWEIVFAELSVVPKWVINCFAIPGNICKKDRYVSSWSNQHWILGRPISFAII